MFNVLIAEDDFRVAQIHEEYLSQVERMNLVGKACNASETLKLLKKFSVDLLLLDVYMPDQLGTELLSKIREKHPEVDIIMITAANDKGFLNKALNYGVEHYLIKPITMERFKETMIQYKKKKELITSVSKVDQDFLDTVFGSSAKEIEKPLLPSGIDFVTLKKIQEIIELETDGITSEKVGKKMGASRTTARRYLEYLVGTGQAISEHVYGIVGRPERRYYSKRKE
jgi:two-component system, CitB family, response regulator CitT